MYTVGGEFRYWRIMGLSVDLTIMLSGKQGTTWEGTVGSHPTVCRNTMTQTTGQVYREGRGGGFLVRYLHGQ